VRIGGLTDDGLNEDGTSNASKLSCSGGSITRAAGLSETNCSDSSVVRAGKHAPNSKVRARTESLSTDLGFAV
jgi:hypothetical protein